MRVAIGQTGAPTAVVDQTVSGVLSGLSGHDVLGVRHGPDGLVDGLFDPIAGGGGPAPGARGGSWLGAGRRAMTPDDVAQVVDQLARAGVEALALVGGNGTMALLKAISEIAALQGTGLRVVGVPKTVDNDLLHTDHAPGYASAARYLASVVPDLARDHHAMQRVEPVRVIETLGRGVGWLALAATWHRDDPEHAPDVVLFPELDVNRQNLLDRVETALSQRGRAFLVVSEGVRLTDDREPFDAVNHASLLHGGVARRLASDLGASLGVPARGEVLGMVQRCASAWASEVDLREAATIGRLAAGLLVGRPDACLDLTQGVDVVTVTTTRQPGPTYAVQHATAHLRDVAGQTRTVPQAWRTDDPTRLEDFYDWLTALIA